MSEDTAALIRRHNLGEPVQHSLVTRLCILEAELAEAKKDTARLDWLADVNTKTGWVMLSRPIIEANMHSMRAAIDAAMEVWK